MANEPRRAVSLGLALGLGLGLIAVLPAVRSEVPERGYARDLEAGFRNPPEAARPWVYWYWMYAAVSREGITADLKAMKEAGIGGAYLMPIKGAADPPWITPPVVQLSPEWWGMVRFAMAEADRLGLKLAMHSCDGFSAAGGPWITPELSMQKVVWTETEIDGEKTPAPLPQPPAYQGYYRDIAILAFPSPPGAGVSTRTTVPKVTTSLAGADASFLPVGSEAQAAPSQEGRPGVFRSEKPCWIQYAFESPFTCRSVFIQPDAINYEANRLGIEASDDGVHFREVSRLVPPRSGWQDGDAGVTHAVREVTARVFRFTFDPAGSEPGGESLDSAKWRPVLAVRAIVLSAEPRINQFEGKSGEVWRVGLPTTEGEAPAGACVPLDRIVDLTSRLDAQGRLAWNPPPGQWTVLRVGHTSTGHHNDTGGGGYGLECDKFNPEAARIQFDHWFGEAIAKAGPDLAGRVLKIFHTDSWECGSQNWSSVFAAEFRRRRGYDPTPYLPAMAGIPVQSAEVSERFLHDVRATIAELLVDNFFRPMERLAHAHGCVYSAESVAPTMESDGMAHFASVDIPMGEFWTRSPTHDKLNDILDAVSGARVYGKPIAQAEAFTELRMGWDEYPGMLKILGDRNYCFGINRFVYHVFTHNPWTDRKPGMTLNGVGLPFQRDLTWWKPGRAWVDYAARCQGVLMQGRPVADVAVFTGEEIPRRAVLPEELLPSLPGVFGPEAVAREARRLGNEGEPQAVSPEGVVHSANIENPADWIDPLRGYAYDSINRDALLRLATVRNGRIVLPGGASYGVLVVPADRALSPEADRLSPEVAVCLGKLARAGATVVFSVRPARPPGLQGFPASDRALAEAAEALWPAASPRGMHPLGVGRIFTGVYREASFEGLGIAPDFLATENGIRAGKIAWTHRSRPEAEIYFISNQTEADRDLEVSVRTAGRVPELWDPVTGDIRRATAWRIREGRTSLPVHLASAASVFLVLREPTAETQCDGDSDEPQTATTQTVDGSWQVSFDPSFGGPEAPVIFDRLDDWTHRPEAGIRFYSGTAIYAKDIDWHPPEGRRPRVWLDVGTVHDLAEVAVNGLACGVAWTPPYRVDITRALRPGSNHVRIAVTNTWANRLMGDHALPEARRTTWSMAPYRLEGHPLLPAGLLGPVTLVEDRTVATAEMRRVYDASRTPFKYGVVLHQPNPGEFVDCPNVFRFGSKWFMVYVSIRNKIGYETLLAESPDLLHWKPTGTILPFSRSGWDQWQADGSVALADPAWGGSGELQTYRGRTWMSYFGGSRQGYESEPLSIGIAWTTAPGSPSPWNRLPGNPVLSPDQPDARPFERATFYKSTVLWDHSESLGYPFVMFYNAKQKGPWLERIGMAVSRDMEHWSFFGSGPVVGNADWRGKGISGDPQIVRMGGLWVMYYFGAGWKPHAFDTFACSYDLVHWTKWTGPTLLSPSEPWDKTYAHKPWLLFHDGIVYHFYCAVGDQGRVIALATSKDLRPKR